MDVVEKSIAGLVENAFPEVYREEGPIFMAFVRAYYEWMESEGQVIYHARRLPAYRDIDDTVDEFLVHFKETYLKGVQFETSTNVRQLVKHALDIYRSKGSHRAIDLFFRLVYGEAASVYLPSRDLFVLSSGKWVRRSYLEVTPRARNAFYVGRQVTGIESGATAFVESLVRRKIDSRYIEVFYISAIRGTFRTGELLSVGDERDGNPIVTGSLSSMTVTAGGTGFAVGDVVTVSAEGGQQGLARVASVSDVTGVVDFVLLDGGWGYTFNPTVLVSESVLTLSDLTTNGTPTSYYGFLEEISQPLAEIGYEAANGDLVPGDVLSVYHANGDVAGTGTVLSVTAANSTAGTLVVRPTSGDLEADSDLFTEGNATTAQTVSYVDTTATATVMGVGTNVTLSVSGASGDISVGDAVTQTVGGEVVAAGTVLSRALVAGTGTIRVEVGTGCFLTGETVETDSGVATVDSISVPIGVVDVSGTFTTLPGNGLAASDLGTEASVATISTGSGASFEVADTLGYTEEVSLNTDLLSDYANVELDAVAYGFPANPTGNSESTIADLLTFSNSTLGSVLVLQSINPGSNYNFAPFVAILEEDVVQFDRRDLVASVSNVSGSFVVGELVTQSNGARGLVKAGSNSSVLYLKRLNFADVVDTNLALKGEFSGATASVDSVSDDPRSERIGLNAVVQANVQAASGSVVSLEVLDSGFGYRDATVGTFTSSDGMRSGSARLGVETQGRAAGFYADRGGFLSSDKKLHDGRYYQVHSYEVRSGIDFNRYATQLRDVLHVAGTSVFGRVVRSSESVEPVFPADSVVEVG